MLVVEPFEMRQRLILPVERDEASGQLAPQVGSIGFLRDGASERRSGRVGWPQPPAEGEKTVGSSGKPRGDLDRAHEVTQGPAILSEPRPDVSPGHKEGRAVGIAPTGGRGQEIERLLQVSLRFEGHEERDLVVAFPGVEVPCPPKRRDRLGTPSRSGSRRAPGSRMTPRHPARGAARDARRESLLPASGSR